MTGQVVVFFFFLSFFLREIGEDQEGQRDKDGSHTLSDYTKLKEILIRSSTAVLLPAAAPFLRILLNAASRRTNGRGSGRSFLASLKYGQVFLLTEKHANGIRGATYWRLRHLIKECRPTRYPSSRPRPSPPWYHNTSSQSETDSISSASAGSVGAT